MRESAAKGLDTWFTPGMPEWRMLPQDQSSSVRESSTQGAAVGGISRKGFQKSPQVGAQ